MGEEITIGPFELPVEDWQQKTARYLECEKQVFERFRPELEEAFNKGFKNVVVVDGEIKLLAIEEPQSLGEIESKFPNKPYYIFKAPPVVLPSVPTTMEEYIKAIRAQAARKGWSTNRLWLQASIYKEVGELVSALEHDESDEKIGLEMADILYFLWQFVKSERPNVNLDTALISKIQDNEVKKKKTVDAEGNIVRK